MDNRMKGGKIELMAPAGNFQTQHKKKIAIKKTDRNNNQ